MREKKRKKFVLQGDLRAKKCGKKMLGEFVVVVVVAVVRLAKW